MKTSRKLKIFNPNKNKSIEPGDRFGFLEVIGIGEKKGTSRHIHYECLCHRCGGTSVVPSYRLKSGATQSCGCTKIKHGHAVFKGGTHEYGVWIEMRRRCNEPGHKGYERYGGRGISVCSRWETSFENFFEDMGPCPQGFQLDRINGNGNYEPGNCRWASIFDQNRNRRDNRYIKYAGKNKILSDWASDWDVLPGFISNRLNKGYSMREIYELSLTRRKK